MGASTTILEKICHLKGLAGSSNPNEAAAAAAAADKLIQKYRIDEAELKMVESSTDFESEDSDFVLYESGRRTMWKSDLACLLAHHYGCAVWIDNGYRKKQYRLVGIKSDMEIVNYMFSWLIKEIDMLTKMFCTGLGHVYSRSYSEGVVAGIRNQLNKTKREAAMQYSGTTALACIDQRLDRSTEAMYKLHNLKKAKITRKALFSGSAYNSGVEAGKKIHLRRGLETQDTKQLT